MEVLQILLALLRNQQKRLRYSVSPKECQLKSTTFDKSRFYHSLDPPRIPRIVAGTLRRILSPPDYPGGAGGIEV
jgi:hypothetical protein